MGWRWKEPKYVTRANGDRIKGGREDGGFPTRERAIEAAIWNAALKRPENDQVRDALWRSLERQGWIVEPEFANV